MAAPSDLVTIGEISYSPKDFIGIGSHGTFVYKGVYQKRNVAVKKIPSMFADLAEKEKDLLLRIDVHPNIVRYYHTEKDNDGYYITLMLCDYTLVEYVKNEYCNFNLTPLKLLHQVTKGLHFLHENQIIHHDLKPLNILISFPSHKNERRALISDFGVSKETLGTRDSVTLTSRRGTDGFAAPEIFTNATVTNAIDVFALGCIYFYVLSSGKQVFHCIRDVCEEKMYKICTDEINETEEYNYYHTLILRMISRDVAIRPTCDQILPHYIFWPNERKKQFLQAISEFLEGNEKERKALDEASHATIGNWIDVMSDNIISDLVNGKRNQGRKFAKENIQKNTRNFIKKYYDGTKISSLIRAIRNICAHSDIIVLAKEEILSSEGFEQYCWEKFPKLFPFVYYTGEKWSSDESIANFYFKKSGKVGQITFQLEPRIKTARNGCILYKGKYKNIKVAVKMYTPNLVMLGKNNWDLLQNIRHRNVIQIHHKEEINSYLYIVSTLGQNNLFEYIQNYWNNDNPVPVQLLRHVNTGLEFLHDGKIVHGDLTPANILISYPIRGKRRAMIADFESSHCDGRTNRPTIKNSKKLLKEWMAPELKDPQRKVSTESSDIYSLGCIYMYVLSNGSQIIGQVSGVGDKALHMQCITESIIAAGLQCHSGLINKMLEYSPKLRPTSYEILQHPIFWRMKQKVDFIKSVLKLVTTNKRAKSLILSATGNMPFEEWTLQVGEDIVIDLGKYLTRKTHSRNHGNDTEKKQEWIRAAKKQYGGKKLSSIINTMIEIDGNYNLIMQESTPLVKKYQGGFIEYFIECFPEIPDFVYTAMKEFKDEQFLYIYYGRAAKGKWSNVNTVIIQSILSKMTLKCNFNCSQISKHWIESEQEFYTSWMKKSCNIWTDSSFINAMENNVNCKEIYYKSSEEWKRETAPNLIKEIDTMGSIQCITISNDGTLLAAVCSAFNIRIYDSKDLRMQFSSTFRDRINALNFNGKDSCILAESDNELHVVKIAEGLPIKHSVESITSIERPWWDDNIFLSQNYCKKQHKTTFYLNEFAETGNTEYKNIQYSILMVKGHAHKGGIVQTDSRNVLVCQTGVTKLVLKNVPKIDLTKYQSKQQPETHDREVDGQGVILDFIEVPDGNTVKLYILAKIEDNDYCFLIIDLDSFQLKTSTLLVPRVFRPRMRNLVSNAKYMASGSYESNCVCIWDIQSGLCISQLKHEENIVLCAVHPIDPRLVITAGCEDKKIKIWQLHTDKS